jgi:pimeloyl-ACP methyl ester carboxylesterase
MIHVEDKRISLPDGRILAYADNGNTSSSTVVLYFHGAFSVGDASRLSPTLMQKNVHFIAPSLHGWGRSSPVCNLATYAKTLAADITALITLLHPDQQNLKLYVCAHCFGTVVAQILCGLSHTIFPLGRRISAIILVSPYSPPHSHRDYSKAMSWQLFFVAGPPTRYVPFSLLPRIAKYLITTKISTVAATEMAVRNLLFDCMGEEEGELFLRWKENQGAEDGELEASMTRNVVKSVAHTWRGFLDMAAIYHTDYEWRIQVDGESPPRRPHIHILSARNDPIAPVTMAEWLSAAYGDFASLKIVEGGRMATLFHLDEIWRQIFD